MSDTSLRKSTISTAIVMGCTFLSRILGFVRMAVIGAIFGAQGEADVLNAVFTIPNNLRKLLAEGALSSAFIPTLSQSLQEDPSRKDAKALSATLLGFQLMILVPLSIIAVIAAEPIIQVLTGFDDPGKRELAVQLFRWMFHYILLISISSVLMAVLNAHSSFTVPAVTPLLFSIGVISSVLFFYQKLGIFSMALGVLAGGVGQILFQLPFFMMKGYSPRPRFHFRDPAFQRILRQWLPVLATSSIFAVNHQVAIRFATGLSDGSPSALTNALVFWQLPFGIFSASITTVLFPRMSRQAAEKDLAGLGKTLEYGLRAQIVLLIPSSLYLIFLAEPLIAMALQRGAFEVWNTKLAGEVLRAYSVGLFSVGAFNYLQRFFYSLGDFRTPFLTALVVAVVDILLSLWWKETALAVSGLAWANSAAFTMGVLILVVKAGRHTGTINIKALGLTLVKIMISLILPMIFIGGFFWFTTKRMSHWWHQGSSWEGLLMLMLLILGIILLQAAGYILARVEMIWVILRKKKIQELS